MANVLSFSPTQFDRSMDNMHGFQFRHDGKWYGLYVLFATYRIADVYTESVRTKDTVSFFPRLYESTLALALVFMCFVEC